MNCSSNLKGWNSKLPQGKIHEIKGRDQKTGYSSTTYAKIPQEY